MPAFQPIGLIRSPFTRGEQTPIQPYRSRAVGQVELLPEYEPGLQELEGFSHVILLYFFHHSEPGYDLTVVPFLHALSSPAEPHWPVGRAPGTP
jgi:tRNA (Thr-GGU) A37 N-methylase